MCMQAASVPVSAAETRASQVQAQKLTPIASADARQHVARQHTPVTNAGIASLQTTSNTGSVGRPVNGPASGTSVPATASRFSQHMSSSPVLLDLQTRVSPLLPTASRVSSQAATPNTTLCSTDTSSPIALAPNPGHAEAPTPTLVPRASSGRPVPADSPVNASPAAATSVLQDSPRDILSSLQDMNLQSKPFNFADGSHDSWSAAVHEATPEPLHFAENDQQTSSGDAQDKTPESFSFSSSPEQAHVVVQSPAQGLEQEDQVQVCQMPLSISVVTVKIQ